MKKLKEFISRFAPEDRAGFYITVIFHLTVIIVLLILQIGSLATRENSFVLDFSRQEEKQRIEEEKAFREDISRKLDELIAAAQAPSNIRNIVVNASSPLKDDRGTDADKLYEDHERLSKALADGKSAVEEDMREETVDISQNKREESKAKEYKGPSVLSYTLDGRKMTHQSIPAYRCMGSGDVVVTIKVDRQGNVTDAKVHDALSSSDQCLRKYAVRAARLTKFNKSTTAPASQPGEIVYRFIAQ